MKMKTQNRMICTIENDVAIAFLKENKTAQDIFVRPLPHWIGAYIDNELVAVMGWKPYKKRVTLHSLLVLPQHRRKGIAEDLYREFLRRFEGSGYTVYDNSTGDCIPLSRKMGFTEVGRYSNGTIKFVLKMEDKHEQ